MDKTKYNRFYLTLSHLKLRHTLALSLNRLYSVNHYFILKRNLSLPLTNGIRIAVTLRKADDADMREIVECLDGLDGESKKEIIARLVFYKAGFQNCYIARTKKNEIAYFQWLIFPSENQIIQKYFSRKFYPLDKGQVMIENAFTFPKFRGLGLLPGVSQKLLRIAKESGYGAAVTYIRKDKIPSLNEFIHMRFKITKLVTEFRFLGITIRAL